MAVHTKTHCVLHKYVVCFFVRFRQNFGEKYDRAPRAAAAFGQDSDFVRILLQFLLPSCIIKNVNS